MAENQGKSGRMRNEAQLGGNQTGRDVRDMDPRHDYDERRTMAWRSLDPFVQVDGMKVPDWQPRD